MPQKSNCFAVAPTKGFMDAMGVVMCETITHAPEARQQDEGENAGLSDQKGTNVIVHFSQECNTFTCNCFRLPAPKTSFLTAFRP